MNRLKPYLQYIQTPYFLVSILTAAGLFLRLNGLNEWYYGHDEMWHVYIARQATVMDVLRGTIMQDNHPPLLYILVHYLMLLWNDPWMARLPSLVAGTALIPLGYYGYKRLFLDEKLGIFAAFVLALSILYVILSNTMRGYVLMMAFTIIGWICIANYRDTGKIKHLFYYYISIQCALLSDVAITLFLPIMACTLAYYIYRTADHKPLVIITYTIIHCLLLASIISFQYALNHWGNLEHGLTLDFPINFPTLSYAAKTTLHAFTNFFFILILNITPMGLVTESLISTGCLALTILFLMGIAYCIKERKWPLLAATVAFFTCICIFYALRITPFSYARRHIAYTLLFIPIFYYGILALAQEKFMQRIKPHGLSILLALSIIIPLTQVIFDKNWRKAMFFEFEITRSAENTFIQHLEHYIKPHDIIFTDWISYQYFWNRNPQNSVNITPTLARYDGFNIPLYYTLTDHRTSRLHITGYSLQRHLKHLSRIKAFAPDTRIWIIAVAGISYKNYIVTPPADDIFNNIISKETYQEKKTLIKTTTQHYQTLSSAMIAAAPEKEIFVERGVSCDENWKEPGCIKSIIAYPVPLSTIRKLVIDIPDFSNPEDFLEQPIRKN